ncbi:bidirectional sugar transporter SWEET14-like [Telopea speciosissima]|uniref:bidirectional sugar transporter SWEET14-like n=1 Tax=Telopea speciosissima TaxID=54955 RepID=UPI001CC44089|nr:bidirectional sugar transporter SWEET14-like [Telopea speciosissima]
MAIITGHHPLAFAFGLLGNIVSFMVYLAPLPTFYRVYKKKSTEAFQSIPYVVAHFSAMLWLYYAFLKPNEYMLITINSIGCTTEAIYIVIYLIYATKEAKIFTVKLLLLFNVGMFGSILTFTIIFAHGSLRIAIVGWICAGFSVSVFAAPLSVMRLVIRTKSVEFMPFSLSFFLTLCAVMWFFYGLLVKDFYIALPNVLGFTFGIVQMILYMIYKDTKKGLVLELKLQELDPNTYPSEDQGKPIEIDTEQGIQEKSTERESMNKR